MNIFSDRKRALAAVYLMPFPLGILLQVMAVKIDVIGRAFFEHWYPFGVIVAVLIITLPSYCLIARLSAFAGKRKFFAGVFTASLIILMPFVSLINTIVVCFGGSCSIGE